MSPHASRPARIISGQALKLAGFLLLSGAVCGPASARAAEPMTAATPSAAPVTTTASADEPAATRRLDAAWSRYIQTLDRMRQELEGSDRFKDHPEDRAKAFHTLMEMQAMAYNFAIQPRLAEPRLFRNETWATNIYSLGQNGPDTDYRMAFLDGTQVYRLTGHVGDTQLTLIQMFNGLFGEPVFQSRGSYDLKDMDVAPDGSFSIVIGGPPQKRNWIPLDPKVRFGFVLIRRMLTDWDKNLGDIAIARISAPQPGVYAGEEFSQDEMAQRIDRATDMVRFLNEEFGLGLYDHYLKGAAGKLNTWSLRPAQTDNQLGNSFSRYAALDFSIADDEALIVTMPKAPQGVYWSFHTGDVWSRSLDFFERQSSLNNDQAELGPDGSLTLVVSAKDPGVKNWLDTAGRRNGVLFMRNYHAAADPALSARIVKFADLPREAPPGMTRLTPSQRAAALERRRASYLRAYGE
jgi:hypothetical protein